MKNLTLVQHVELEQQPGSSILVEQWSYLGASSNYVLCQDYMEQPSQPITEGQGYYNNNTIWRNIR